MRILPFFVLSLMVGCTGEGATDSGGKDSTPVDVDGDGYSGADDCDDDDAAVHVGATEACNEVDDDCDGDVDEDAADASTWYADSDGDQFGDAGAPTLACTAPSGTVADDTDCDDAEATVNPAAAEVCNLVDDDCDSDVDEDATDATSWYPDGDNDAYGAGEPILACNAPDGFVGADGDCDDADPAYHPDATEDDCTDPNDYNCDGSVAYEDADADGYPACQDCDDRDGDVHPAAEELCDGLDNNCDGHTDDATATGAVAWYADADGDGYGDASVSVTQCDAPTGFGSDPTDCDDTDARVNPAAVEVCDSIDNDCDLEIDEDSAVDAMTWYADADGDTFGDAAAAVVSCVAPSGYGADGTDCDDREAGINPAAVELCDDVDNNCDGAVDEASAADAATWYADIDGDSFGDASAPSVACDVPAGHVSDAADCVDADAAINPDATEMCDGVDNNCDDTIDEATAADAATWHADTDGDSFGDTDSPLVACEQPGGYVVDALDCDDGDLAVNPDATELCDSVDNNCDGATDDVSAADKTAWYADDDADGFGDPLAVLEACGQPEGYLDDDGDCNDGDAAINPDATEVCDGADNDCDGGVDDAAAVDRLVWFADADGDTFGDPGVSVLACEAPRGYLDENTDCDDTNGATHPGADEVCDGIDNNCDALIDDASAVDQPTWYVDTDGDGYGADEGAVTSCEQPSGTIAVGGDCDEADVEVNPGATEWCDGIDNDCSSTTSETRTVTQTHADGSRTDLTSTLSTGTSSSPVAADVDGTLDFCDGVWYVSLTATDDLSIQGHSSTAVRPTLDGGSIASVLHIATDGVEVNIDSVSIQRGVGTELSASGRTMGGGIVCAAVSSVGLSNVLATGNYAGVGGFMVIDGCDVQVSDALITSNSADYGAGIFILGGSLVVEDTQILGNTATTTGGGIASEAAEGLVTVDLVDTVVRNNRATYGGGLSAIYEVEMSCTGTVSDAGTYGNTASSLGGGLLLWADGYSLGFDSTMCDWGDDGGTTDNRATDVLLYDTYVSYEYGSDATFSCDATGCI